MTRDKQIEFINELTLNVTAGLVADIEAGKTPDTWDGVELRQFIADRYAGCIIKGLLTGSRRRAYNNHIIVNDL